MGKRINFEVEKAEIVEEQLDSHFATARIECFSSGWNRHDTFVTPENLAKNALTIGEKPVIFELEGIDFGKHSDVTIPAGFVVPGSETIIKRNDGRDTLVVDAKIWKRYSGEFLDIFARTHDGKKKKSVSVEMVLLEPDELIKDGELITWEFAAICVLGDFYTPASPDANMEILSFAKAEKESYERVLFKEFGKYRDVDFEIPEDVKLSAKAGLELNLHLNCATSADMAFGKYLSRNKTIDPKRIRMMSRKLKRLKSGDISNKKSEDWCRYQLWGGNPGETWSTMVSSEMDEIDEKVMEYFEEGETMPYENKSQFPPALKGITPPITVAQANSIAKQAESIGTDDKKNGWAIAISNFKKTHTPKNGKWVIKDKEDKFVAKDINENDNLETVDELVESTQVEMASEEEEKDDAEMASEEEEKEKDDAEMASEEEEKDDAEMASEEEEEEEDGEEEDDDEPKSEMSAEFIALKTENEALMAEVVELRKFKADVHKAEFEAKVGALFSEVAELIPQDEAEKLRKESENFSVETFDGFANKVKAIAFGYASKIEKKDPDDDSEKFLKMELPFVDNKNKNYIW